MAPKNNMRELKIHSEGQKDHLKALREKYEGLKNSLKRNSRLNAKEKQTELKKITEEFAREKKDLNQKL